jgi:LEA14-like dessication related protein
MRILAAVSCTLMLAGCAAWSPYQERPQVNITSFNLASQSTGTGPRFVIGVQVVNPNRASLPLRGMSYAVEIGGRRILSGAAAGLPEVPPYGSADFVIEAGADLLGSARLLSDLLSGQRDGDVIDYTFRARLDVGGLMRDVRIVESGSFDMARDRR